MSVSMIKTRASGGKKYPELKKKKNGTHFFNSGGTFFTPAIQRQVAEEEEEIIQRNEMDDVEEAVEEEGERFRAERRADLGRIIEGMRFRKVLRDCPGRGGSRLIRLLAGVRQRALSNPRCRRFFQRTFGFGPERVLELNRPPTLMIDPDLESSGRTRCPSPSVRFQPAICTSPLQDRVIMHELTHYAGCLLNNRPSSEEVAASGEDTCIGTVAQELERRRQRAREQPAGGNNP
jgi:hypothetical protein